MAHRILVVDDVRFTRLSVVRMLQQIGDLEIHEAEDGVAALRWFDDAPGPCSCVVSDLEMPRMNGLELLKAVRTGGSRAPRDLPVVLLTGQTELSFFVPALALDLDTFVAKPVSQQKLRRCLEGVLETRHAVRDVETYRAVQLDRIALEGEPASSQAPAADHKERGVSISSVPRDAILSRDLTFDNGRLLLGAGTRLSAYMLQRLQELAPLSALTATIWIVD